MTGNHYIRFALLWAFWGTSASLGVLYAQTPMILNGSATDFGGGIIRLTDNVTLASRSAAWFPTQLDLNQPFDLTYNIFFENVWGADGMAFVMHQDPNGTASMGASGNALGFGNSVPPTLDPPITPSVAIEIDTWDNSGAGVDDLLTDHLAVHINGDMTNAVISPVNAHPAGNDITDGTCHTLRMVWDPATNNLEVYFDGLQRIAANYDIRTPFAAGPVWYGFTAACGGIPMEQYISLGDVPLNIPDQAVCQQDSLRLSLSAPHPSIRWSPATYLSCTNCPTPTFFSTSPGTFTYEVEVQNILGCIKRDTFDITVHPTPTFATQPLFQICTGDSVNIGGSATPGIQYSWVPVTGLDNPLAANPLAAPANNTNYTVSLTNITTGCNSSATTQVDILPTPAADAGPDQTLCGTEATLQAQPASPASGQWTSPSGATLVDSSSEVSAVNTLQNGSNIFIWTVDNGVCASTDTTEIVATWPAPPADAGADQTLDGTFSTQLAGNLPGNGIGTWNLISPVSGPNIVNTLFPSSLVTGLQFGNNLFTWTISNAPCPATVDTVNILVRSLIIPDGFSPNSDGKNDIFVIRGIENYSGAKLVVFNRWGNVVFQSGNYDNTWDGNSIAGKSLVEDTYYYVLELPQGQNLNGFVVLKR